jgi:hypothetical protein
MEGGAYVAQKTRKCKANRGIRLQDHITVKTTKDKQNATIREYLASRADFVGAIRLPSSAFKREGTSVVTDIVFFRKRAAGEPADHVDSQWQSITPLVIDGVEVAINRYFVNHAEMVLGTLSRKDTLYGEGYSVQSTGNLEAQLREAIARLPQFSTFEASRPEPRPSVSLARPPPQYVTEGSFFVAENRTICQWLDGQAVPVIYGRRPLRAGGTFTAKRLAALIRLRDAARRVLQSQNEGWPESDRNQARRDLNWAYDCFESRFGPINKTTFAETA